MKKVLTLILTLWCSAAWAVEPINLARGFNPYVAGAGVAAAGTCSASTNEVGDRTDYSASGEGSIANGEMMCLQYTADCSGTLGYGYVNSTETTGDHFKICVYTEGNADAVPTSADETLSGMTCSAVTGASAGWQKTAGKLGGSVTSGSTYWVCGIVDSTFGYARISTGGTRTRFYQSGLNYSSPPANLTGTWNDTLTGDEWSVYVEIE